MKTNTTFPTLILMAAACLLAAFTAPAQTDDIPAAPREFRGVWLSTVSNLDWPTRRGLPTADQQRELIELLDRAAALRLNAIILQVRPASDALYASRIEPWSEYLTGQQGRAPEPFWDPLAFAVDEAHKRGMRLHAWINPYRAGTKASGTPAPNHVSNTHPQIVKTYDGAMTLDPGHPDTVPYVVSVVRDILERYDVDGIHIDDYFYPSPARDGNNQVIAFPDAEHFQAYRAAGGQLGLDDWRRNNINRLVRALHEEVRTRRPEVTFGVSPFGIWRPNHPEGIRGRDAYQEIYCDSRLWLHEGWLDYLAPQLYWPDGGPQSYTKLLDWWLMENRQGRHIWPGLAVYKIRGESPYGANEIPNQILQARNRDRARGHALFRYRSLDGDPQRIETRLKNELYALPALVPASPWLGTAPPPAPLVSMVPGSGGSSARVQWSPPPGTSPKAVRQWVVYADLGSRWWIEVLPAGQTSLPLRGGANTPARIAVSAVDRLGNESPRAVVHTR